MKNIKSANILVIVFLIYLVMPEYAAAYYYSLPPVIYVEPTPDLGKSIGDFGKALNKWAQEKEQQEQIEQLQNYLKTAADQEVNYIARRIPLYNPKGTIEKLSQEAYEKGYMSKVETLNGIESITLSFKPDTDPNCPIFVFEYSINTTTKQCRVITSVPSYNLQQMALQGYSDRDQTFLDYTPETYLPGQGFVNLGLFLSEEMVNVNGQNGFTVSYVIDGDPGANSGILPEDIIVKVDSYDINDQNLEQIASHITNQMLQNKTIIMEILRLGLKKTITINQ